MKFLKKTPSDFPHKKGGFGKIGGVLKKGVSLMFIRTNPFQCYLSLSVWCVCVLCLFISFPSALFVSQEQSGLSLHDFHKLIIFEKKIYWK